jgi:hypothetical protein
MYGICDNKDLVSKENKAIYKSKSDTLPLLFVNNVLYKLQ